MLRPFTLLLSSPLNGTSAISCNPIKWETSQTQPCQVRCEIPKAQTRNCESSSKPSIRWVRNHQNTMCCWGPNPLTLRNFQNGSTGLFKWFLCVWWWCMYIVPIFLPFFCMGGPQKCFFCPKIIVFAPKSSFPAISGSSRLKWVEHRSNWVEHYISHPGWSVETF